jgi:hypothetical protein
MRKVPVLLGVLVVLGSSTVCADNGTLGLGVIIGEPTGISGKLWLSGRTAIDGAVAWSFDKNAKFQVHGDFLVHRFDVIKVEKGRLLLYYGIGGRVKMWESDHDDNVGIRFPVGLEYLIASTPLDLFLEVVPILDIAPHTDVEFSAAIGMRYFF